MAAPSGELIVEKISSNHQTKPNVEKSGQSALRRFLFDNHTHPSDASKTAEAIRRGIGPDFFFAGLCLIFGRVLADTGPPGLSAGITAGASMVFHPLPGVVTLDPNKRCS